MKVRIAPSQIGGHLPDGPEPSLRLFSLIQRVGDHAEGVERRADDCVLTRDAAATTMTPSLMKIASSSRAPGSNSSAAIQKDIEIRRMPTSFE
jgi:hypothetical protein